MINDKGQLFRKGEEIGKVVEGSIELKPQHKNYVAAVTRWVNQQASAPSPSEVKPSGKILEAPKLTPKQQEEADLKGVAEEAREEAKAYKDDWRDDLAFAKKNGIPEPPKRNPQFGDKSPSYVEWLHKHRPDKFHTKFINKGKGKIPVFAVNPEIGVEEHKGWKEVDFTLRKTHMTEKAEANQDLDESLDWDA